jgi:hypothetical protein
VNQQRQILNLELLIVEPIASKHNKLSYNQHNQRYLLTE